jgi:hypothetical protein
VEQTIHLTPNPNQLPVKNIKGKRARETKNPCKAKWINPYSLGLGKKYLYVVNAPYISNPQGIRHIY